MEDPTMSILTDADLELEVIVRYALPDRTGLGGTMFRQRFGDCTIGQLDLLIGDILLNRPRVGRAKTGSFPVIDHAASAWLEILYARREKLRKR
jgi:hypothetical protein